MKQKIISMFSTSSSSRGTSSGTFHLDTPPDQVPEMAQVERGNWSGKFDFLLSLLGYAIGLGSVWRFPYLVFKHGGGAFLIPYFVMLFVVGIPCFFLELTIGQYAAMGPTRIYDNLCPLFSGLGISNFYVSIMVALYYNMIVAWTIYYSFASFTSDLPWGKCGQEFNSEFCFSISDYKNCTAWRDAMNSSVEMVYHRGHCITEPEELSELRNNLSYYYGCKIGLNSSDISGVYVNESCSGIQQVQIEVLQDVPRRLRQSSAEEYFKRNVLKETNGIDAIGGVEWQLALSLLAAWILTFLCLFKGIQTSGKVVYFTALFPIVVLVILLIRAATLPGAMTGVEFYIRPNFGKLSDVKVWEAAAVQIFFSLSVAGGGLTTLSSYNKFHDSIVASTLIVCFGTSILAVLAGFTIFSVLGFMAEELGVRVEDVVREGSGLAFIAFPDLVTRLPISPLWAILFFFMMFCLGLDSQFATVEIVLTGILDWEPRLRKFKSYVIAAVCSLGFLLGLPLTTGGGRFVLELVDFYVPGWPFLFIALCELIIVSYIYGLDNFQHDIKAMIGIELSPWGKTHFNFVFYSLSPIVLFFLLILSWAQYEPLTSGSYVFPVWANGLGWTIAMLAIIPVPLMAAAQILRRFSKDLSSEKSFVAKLWLVWRDLLNPTTEWRMHAEVVIATEAEREAYA